MKSNTRHKRHEKHNETLKHSSRTISTNVNKQKKHKRQFAIKQHMKGMSTANSGSDISSNKFYNPRISTSLDEGEILKRKNASLEETRAASAKNDEFKEFIRSTLDENEYHKKLDSEDVYRTLPVDKNGLLYDPTTDPKNPLYIPKPNVDDPSNPYSLASNIDNNSYVRQIGITRTFQDGLMALYEKNIPSLIVDTTSKPKDITPSTRGEMNAMLQHAIFQERNFELAWDRFSMMIANIRDENKTRLEHALYEQFNTPILFKRDYNIDSQRQKVLFGPDLTSLQFMLVGILESFNNIKANYDQELYSTVYNVYEQLDILNAQYDDCVDNNAKILWNELSTAKREIERRKTLPIDIQKQLGKEETSMTTKTALSDTNNSSTGLTNALLSMVDPSKDSLSNRLEYTAHGITVLQEARQKRDKMNALGQVVVDIADSPFEQTTVKYRAQRVISSEDDVDDSTSNDNDDVSDDILNKHAPLSGATNVRHVDQDDNVDDADVNQHNEKSEKNSSFLLFGPDIAYRPLVDFIERPDGTLRYKVNLPSLPFAIKDGSELDHWLERLDIMGHGAEQRGYELFEMKKELLEDPYSEAYNCYKDISVWSSRLQFILSSILEHYYAVLYKKNPKLYAMLRHTSDGPDEGLFGMDPANKDIGNDMDLLYTAVNAAKEQGLFYTWLEASTLLGQFSPAPQHVPTLKERGMMIKKQFLQEQCYNEMLVKMPTYNDTIDAQNDVSTQSNDDNVEQKDDDTKKQQTNIPPMSKPHFFKTIELFSQYGKLQLDYLKLVKEVENNFLSKINKKLHKEFFLDSAPDKIYRNSYDSYEEMQKVSDTNDAKKNDTKRHELVTLENLTAEQKEELHKLLPKKPMELSMLERVSLQTIHRYPLLASLAPQSTELYQSLDVILKTKFPQPSDQDVQTTNNNNNNDNTSQNKKKRISPRFFSLKQLPVAPSDINLLDFGFNDEKISQLNYPPQVEEKIASLDISMIKVPVIHTITQPEHEISLKNTRSNIRSLVLSPNTAFMPINDAIEWVNTFTDAAKFVKIQAEQAGEVEESVEYQNLLAQQQYLQAHYNIQVPLHELTDISCNYRHMSRLGLLYIDAMIMSYAQQTNQKLPKKFIELFDEYHQFIENDVVKKHSTKASDNQSTPTSTKTTTTPEESFFGEEVKAVTPYKNRLEQWHERRQNLFINPAAFYAQSIQDRVNYIDSYHEKEREKNIFAQFFNLEKYPERYHLLRSYLRFAIRSGDELSLKKALYVYRSSTRLLEWVQRRSNDDVYTDTSRAASDALSKARSEEEFMKINEEIEVKRSKKREFSQNVPGATRLDMTHDDLERSTTNQPDSSLWSNWYRTNETSTETILKNAGVDESTISHRKKLQQNEQALIEQQSKSQKTAEKDDFDVLLAETGILDDYTSRIDALLHNSSDPVLHKADAEEIEKYQKSLHKHKNKKMGNLFVPGFDMSDGEAPDDEEESVVNNSNSSSINNQGKMQHGNKELPPEYSPQQRLKNLSKASHVPFDYMLTQMVINFHQLLVRNQYGFTKVGLPSDIDSKRFSDEISAQWALQRRALYDARIDIINELDKPHGNLAPEDPIRNTEETEQAQRQRKRERTKLAIQLLKKDRPEDDLLPFERLASQIAIMCIDTMILEGYLAVAKIVAKQAYDDGLLTKEFIDEHFVHHGPDLNDDEATILKKEFGDSMNDTEIKYQ